MGCQELPELMGEGAPQMFQASQSRRQEADSRLAVEGLRALPSCKAGSQVVLLGVPCRLCCGHCPMRTEGLVAGGECQAGGIESFRGQWWQLSQATGAQGQEWDSCPSLQCRAGAQSQTGRGDRCPHGFTPGLEAGLVQAEQRPPWWLTGNRAGSHSLLALRAPP